jgi:hypothetical protein
MTTKMKITIGVVLKDIPAVIRLGSSEEHPADDARQ